MRTRFHLYLVLFAACIPLSHADIYYCSDSSGKTIYKDSECAAGEKTVKVIEDELAADEPMVERAPENRYIEDGKPGKLVFIDNKPLVPPYKIKVSEVRVISETGDNLVVDVIYTYKHDIPVDEIRLFVLPNHGYWSTAHINISNGNNVGRASIGLSRRNMKKDRKTRSFTDTLRVSFEHYPPTNTYNGVVWTETVKYEKNWVLKKQ